MGPDWRRISDDLRRHEANEITEVIEELGLDVGAFESALSGKPVDDALEAELRSLWRTAAESDGCLLLALYVYARYRRTWELSIDHVPLIDRTIDATYAAWSSVDLPGDGSQATLAGIVLEQSIALKDCMAAENACQCSCPVSLTRLAEAVAHRSARLLAGLPAPGPDDDAAAYEIVRDTLRADELMYSALAELGTGVLAVLAEEPGATAALERAIETLRRRESDPALAGAVGESELRAYRHGLTALRGYLLDPSIPHLELTEAGLVYLYPFTFDGTDPRKAGESAIRLWGHGQGTSRLARQLPQSARPTELSDIWYWGHRDRPSYGGTTVMMPGLSVTTTAGEVIDGYRVEVRLNDLGNHYVRIESPRGPLSLHETNQGLRRGSRYMGEELVHGEQGVTWARLRDYADELIDDLAVAIGRGTDHLVKELDGDGHVLLEIRDASVRDSGELRPAAPDDILRAAGPLIFQSAQSLTTSLEEWVRYPVPKSAPDVLEGCAFADSWGARTDNMTTLFMPGAPNWSWIEYEEVVELTASVSALFRLWRRQVDQEFRQVHTEIKRHSETPQRLRDESEPKLTDLRLSLGDFMAEVRSQRAELRSDQLVTSAAARHFMNNLFQVADISRRESDLDVRVAELDGLYVRLTTHLDVLQERLTRGYQRFIEFVLAGVALFSLAEFLGFLNSLFFAGPVPVHGLVEVVVFVVFAVTVLTAIALARRRT
jgi:hypothetical protein